jgi:antitoxin (DNA-binding transcriptional repressor) of toxin-antitoxin stability system
VIAKAGKPVAKLSSIHAKRKALPYGMLKGKLKAKADFDAPLPDDVIAAFEGR